MAFPRSAALAGLILAAGACTAPPPATPPVPPPMAAPSRPAPPPMPEEPANWIDAPRTPGDWSYARRDGGTVATYRRQGGSPDFMLTCDRSSRTVTIARAATITGPVLMRFLAESATRLVESRPASGDAWLTVSVDPDDPLLDALAFSKGRFAVEATGMPTLYLPSWSEVTRVVEDCR